MLEYVRLYRMLWLSGRFGGGKTSLAIMIAIALCSKGYARYIASNVPLFVGREVRRVDLKRLRELGPDGKPVVQHTVIILDEAWQHLGERKGHAADDWLAYMRKANCYLLMPSVLPLAKVVQQLVCARFFNGLVFGIPLWLYWWRLGKGKGVDGDKGRFWWWHPQQVFGYYDHSGVPLEDYIIYDTWESDTTDTNANGQGVDQSEGVN